MSAMRDLTGQRFAWLTVERLSGERNARGAPLWLCKCGCGGTKLVTTADLSRGMVTSCGCRKRRHTIRIRRGWAVPLCCATEDFEA